MRYEMRPLGDFVTLASGNTPSKSNPVFWGGSTPWVSAKDMGEFWIEDAEDHLTEAGVAAASRLVPEGTVLLLTRGMTLHKRVPICRVARASTFNQDVKAVLPKPSISPRYLPYLLVGNHDRLHERVDSAGHGTGRLNTDSLLSLPVYVPALPEQEGVADIGEALDGRLRLLRQTNATLEAIAQALFKSWFIDFDPVHAKAAGREPEGMDAETAALFPAEFEESELGMIPKGWRVGSVYDIAEVVYGAPFASKLFNSIGEGLPLVRIRDLKDEAPGVWTPEVHPKGTKINAGDIIVGMDGEFRAYLWGGETAWMNQRICLFKPINGHCAAFVRESIAAPLAHVEATETATTVIHLGKGDIDRFRLVTPPPMVASAFGSLCQPLYDRIVSAKQAMRSLAGIRDSLLPRLISGKLRLPEAREQLAEAQLEEVTA